MDTRSINHYQVKGYATIFDTPYKLYGDSRCEIWEQIRRYAFDDTAMGNVWLLHDHKGAPLATTEEGTLQLHIKKKGLLIVADLSKSNRSREFAEEIKCGVYQMSIGMIADTTRDYWHTFEDNGKLIVVRTVNRILSLREVTITTEPANPETMIR